MSDDDRFQGDSEHDRAWLEHALGGPTVRRIERETSRARRMAEALNDTGLFDLRNHTQTDWRRAVVDTLLQQRGYDLT